MAVNRDTKVYAGGILNRINHITLRTSGKSTAIYMDLTPDQTTSPHGIVERITGEPPTERSLQDGVKDNDV